MLLRWRAVLVVTATDDDDGVGVALLLQTLQTVTVEVIRGRVTVNELPVRVTVEGVDTTMVELP